MDHIMDLRDHYMYTKDRIVLTEEELRIPGIRMFGRHVMNSATPSIFWHYHRDAFEFSIPAGGTFSFSTETADYNLPGGDVFVSFPNEVHGTNLVPVTAGDLYWFQLDVSDEENLLFLSRGAGRYLKEKLLAPPHHLIRTELRRTVPLIRQMFDLAVNGADSHLTAACFHLFLQMLIVYAVREPFPMSPDIRKARDEILADPCRDFALEDLARTAGLSCSQFKQKFKAQLGVSPRHFINAKKIDHAKKLLSEGRSVTEVSMLLNFTTSSYFATVFKKYTMETPTEYQKKLKNRPGSTDHT